MPNLSDKTKSLRQSGIRAASTRCAQINGINLGQGICDLPIPESIKEAAYQAIDNDCSIYSACEGYAALRIKLEEKIRSFNHIQVNPLSEIVITHGSTGAFVCAATALFNPGDEVILFEPFYGYHKNILEMQGLTVKTVPICLKDFSIDVNDIEKIISPKTKGIVICTPNNPSGKVYTRNELQAIAEIAVKHDLFVITDEIYEYITYPNHEHVSFASLDDSLKQRTVTISGFSKTYNMTGWRMGYVVSSEAICQKLALIQDLLYVCPVTPLQHAVIAALDMPQTYYEQMRAKYLTGRNHMVKSLTDLGFKVPQPQGAYYLMADFTQLGFKDCEEATKVLLEEAKVATVPGDSFYVDKESGKNVIRFCYALTEKKIDQALEQLQVLRGR